jgi:hypothetical protein
LKDDIQQEKKKLRAELDKLAEKDDQLQSERNRFRVSLASF